MVGFSPTNMTGYDTCRKVGTMDDVNKYEIDWWAWGDARVPSTGTEIEYGVSEDDAIKRFLQRYPSVGRIDRIRKLK